MSLVAKRRLLKPGPGCNRILCKNRIGLYGNKWSVHTGTCVSDFYCDNLNGHFSKLLLTHPVNEPLILNACWNLCLRIPTVADPGFSRGGAPTPKSAIIFQFFLQKTAWKWKNLDPGGRQCPRLFSFCTTDRAYMRASELSDQLLYVWNKFENK